MNQLIIQILEEHVHGPVTTKIVTDVALYTGLTNSKKLPDYEGLNKVYQYAKLRVYAANDKTIILEPTEGHGMQIMDKGNIVLKINSVKNEDHKS